MLVVSNALASLTFADDLQGTALPAATDHSQSAAVDSASQNQPMNLSDNTQSKPIQGTSANGDQQTTIIDQNGNLKVIDKSGTQSGNSPQASSIPKKSSSTPSNMSGAAPGSATGSTAPTPTTTAPAPAAAPTSTSMSPTSNEPQSSSDTSN